MQMNREVITIGPPVAAPVKPVFKPDAKEKVELPKQYAVLILNDPVTPFDFVVSVLQQVFGHPRNKAQQIMLKAHTTGIAHCGTFTKEIAETRCEQIRIAAAEAGYPLSATFEEA